jgi:hypothetical protein
MSQDHYTKHALLGEDKQGVWDCASQAISRGCHYMLPDLKRLAYSPELDNVTRISVVQSDQYCDATGQGGIHMPSTHFEEQQHILPPSITNGEGLEISTARSISSFQMHSLPKQKGAGFLSEASADPAARGPPVAQLGRQGHFAAEPAEQLFLRDSTPLRFTADRVAWPLGADSPALELPSRGPGLGVTVQTGNHQPSPLWQIGDSGHDLSLDHEIVIPSKNTSHSERPPADEEYKEPSSHSGSDEIRDHLHNLDGNRRLDDWIGHRKTQNVCHQDLKTLFNSHTEPDQILLHGPTAFLDNTAIILDNLGAPPPDPAFTDPVTGPSSVRQYLPSVCDNLTAAARFYKITNTDIGVDHSEEKAATGGFDIDRLQRDQPWPPRLRSEGLFQEAENEFLGFTRPHILY